MGGDFIAPGVGLGLTFDGQLFLIRCQPGGFSSEQLGAQAQTLRGLVDRFRVDSSGRSYDDISTETEAEPETAAV